MTKPSVLRSASAMGAATFMSRILGLARELVFAYLFGASSATDAFNVAFRIPNLLRDLFAEGAMSAALVPTFTQVRLKEGSQRAWRVAGRVFRLLFLITSLIAVAGILLSPLLVGIYAGAFKEIPGKFELAVQMTQVMFPFFPLVALAAAFMGILNACGVFFLPAFASALFNLTSILVGVTLVFLAPYFNIEPIVGMAIGVLAGGAVQAFCQLPALFKVGYRYQPVPNEPPALKDPAIRKMFKMMIPGTVGLGATQMNLLVNTILATSQGVGAISWLNYAFRLMQFPVGIFGVSLAQATLPKISEQTAKEDFKGFSETLTKSMQLSLAINLLAAAALGFLGHGIIQLLFEYGRFTSLDTESTAMALAAYAVGLAFYSAVKVLVPACYALDNTRIPVTASILSVITTIIFNVLMVKSLGFAGLALGTSISALINTLFLYFGIRFLLKKRGVEFSMLPLLKTTTIYLVLGIGLGFLSHLAYENLNSYVSSDFFSEWIGKLSIPLVRALKLGTAFVVFGGATWILAEVLKLSEFQSALSLLRQKTSKRFGKT